MKLNFFSALYEKVLAWSSSPYALYFLALISVIEAIFFPIPPDIMLVTMTLADRRQYLKYAAIATLFSVLGGILAYFLGVYFVELMYQYIEHWGYAGMYATLQDWFQRWGFWIVFISGFLPLPYKLFAIGAGTIGMNLSTFILASILRRSLRFFAVSFMVHKYEQEISFSLKKHVNLLGWLCLIGMCFGFLAYSSS